MSCGHIEQLVAIGPNRLAGSCRKFGGIVPTTDLIFLIVHLFVGGRLY
jgi:hypothetical protein